jgi:ribulose-5-phosphate 4-epimerase/fuculose-1-phosphate aldolase
MRLPEDRMLVTSTRSWMANLTADQVTVCRIADGSVVSGPAPTVELGIHAGILRTRPDVNVVFHFQTPFATTLACSDSTSVDFFVIPEIPYYIGPVARVPYILPGTEKLAKAVVEAMREHDMVVMSNHGQVTVGHDLAQAIQNAEFFELACEIIVRSGEHVMPLTDEAVKEILDSRQTV